MNTPNIMLMALCLLCLSPGLPHVADAQTPSTPAKPDPLAILNNVTGALPYSAPIHHQRSYTEAQAAEAQTQAVNQHERQGEALLRSGDKAGAIAAFQKALALAPDDGLAEQRLAEAYTASGQPGRALDTYRRLMYHVPGQRSLTSNESSPTVLMHFALLLLQAGQETEALAAYRRGISILDYDQGRPSPGVPVPIPDLGDGLGQVPYTPQMLQAMAHLALGVDTNDLNEWVNECRAAAKLAPDSAAAQYYLGRSLLSRDPAASRAALEKAIQLGDDKTAQEANIYLKMLR